MNNYLCCPIFLSSLITYKFQAYTVATLYPKLFLGILFHLRILCYVKRRNSV